MDMEAKNGTPIPANGDDRDSADITEYSEPLDSGKEKTNGDGAKVENGRKATNAKDPSRPRRKKARRACFACQRAHLTCGDERPCQRCIKRGLQDACHDGVRKKAKYLHDAPDGALMPGVPANFYNNGSSNNNNNMRNSLPMSRNGTNTSSSQQQPPPQQQANSNFYPTPQPQPQSQPPGSYNMYQESTLSQSPFTTQSPVSPTFNLKTSQNGRNPSLSSVNQQPTPSTALSAEPSQPQNPFAGPFFDPSDPALFNFDLSSMNFENRYGALEFGMLGHMATGAGDSPSDSATQRGSIGRSGSAQFSTPAPGFGESPGNQPFMFGDPLLNEWSAGQASGQPHVNVSSVYGQNGMLPGHLKADGPHAFAIESGPASFTSPGSASSPHVTTAAFDDGTFNNASAKSNNSLAPSGQRPVISTPSLKHQQLQVAPKRRHRNPSSIYESVKEPYGYTSGFHNLTAFIQRRFTPQKTVRIAKALASIRPSFIATTKTLNRDDLIFMEKCFQRTLWEYEDFINACGTPTIVCRRTGEIAAVGKEFSILTGWKKDVLLGKEPNLNVNTGGTAIPASGTTSRGSFTPRGSTLENTSGRPQPVFLAELLDDDSVVEFYEDFARLAFGDSRGSVMTRCKLLKYKTKEDTEAAQSEENGKWNNHLRKGGIAGEAGMNQLGFKDGKVECAYCWTVKRDVFDIPMLIVMNFLPCI